jgi:hypothetical protein
MHRLHLFHLISIKGYYKSNLHQKHSLIHYNIGK